MGYNAKQVFEQTNKHSKGTPAPRLLRNLESGIIIMTVYKDQHDPVKQPFQKK